MDYVYKHHKFLSGNKRKLYILRGIYFKRKPIEGNKINFQENIPLYSQTEK